MHQAEEGAQIWCPYEALGRSPANASGVWLSKENLIYLLIAHKLRWPSLTSSSGIGIRSMQTCR